jgi:hypothetical protein
MENNWINFLKIWPILYKTWEVDDQMSVNYVSLFSYKKFIKKFIKFQKNSKFWKHKKAFYNKFILYKLNKKRLFIVVSFVTLDCKSFQGKSSKSFLDKKWIKFSFLPQFSLFKENLCHLRFDETEDLRFKIRFFFYQFFNKQSSELKERRPIIYFFVNSWDKTKKMIWKHEISRI